MAMQKPKVYSFADIDRMEESMKRAEKLRNMDEGKAVDEAMSRLSRHWGLVDDALYDLHELRTTYEHVFRREDTYVFEKRLVRLKKLVAATIAALRNVPSQPDVIDNSESPCLNTPSGSSGAP